MRTLAQQIASLADARRTCQKLGNHDWYTNHSEALERIARDYLPSGSGIDSGTQIDLDATGFDKIVLTTSYHHMNENGCYDGWTDHKITIRPSFLGLDITIGGRNRNDIKDYLHEVFHHCLSSECDEIQSKPVAS
jgi:hypothetical protein